MKKFNKMLMILAVVMFASVLVACGQDETNTSDSNQTTENSETTDTSDDNSVTVDPNSDNTIYTFEAEYTNVDDLIGAGFSGGTSGTGMILPDTKNGDASNGYYISYLYNPGLTLVFNIESDAAVADAELVLRVSAEVKDMTITSDMYTVKVNGLGIGYDDMEFTDVPSMSSNSILPFRDITIGNISLVEGTNTIELVTTNSEPIAGTMYATAPMVDCIKVITDADLSWTPITENIE